jgi:Zn-finger protein
MVITDRALVRSRRSEVQAWECSECGWVHSSSSILDEMFEPREDLEAAFHLHKCERYPQRTSAFDNLN